MKDTCKEFRHKKFGCIVVLDEGEAMPALNKQFVVHCKHVGDDVYTIWDTNYNGLVFLPFVPQGEEYQRFTLAEFMEKLPEYYRKPEFVEAGD